MNSRALLGVLALVVLGLLLWELRWVLLILFGAVVLAVALDVPVTLLRRRLPLNRPAALALVLAVLGLISWKVSELLLPELVQQANEFTQLVPLLLQRLGELAGQFQGLQNLEQLLVDPGRWERLQPPGLPVARRGRQHGEHDGPDGADGSAGPAAGPRSPQPSAVVDRRLPPLLPA